LKLPSARHQFVSLKKFLELFNRSHVPTKASATNKIANAMKTAFIANASTRSMNSQVLAGNPASLKSRINKKNSASEIPKPLLTMNSVNMIIIRFLAPFHASLHQYGLGAASIVCLSSIDSWVVLTEIVSFDYNALQELLVPTFGWWSRPPALAGFRGVNESGLLLDLGF
jgi:hypothetical protein